MCVGACAFCWDYKREDRKSFAGKLCNIDVVVLMLLLMVCMWVCLIESVPVCVLTVRAATIGSAALLEWKNELLL